MAQEAISSNRRIAKNTVMLYIRMLLSMVVSLYTSRVVLNTLGVEDYGIYGVVGGVVAMFSFLNSAMSGATSRFLTYEMGRGDTQRLRDTFSSALLIHIGISLVILLLGETVGLWFLTHKLVIPEERMFAAHVVYQLSIISTMVSITQVPYNATIIAHEQMDVYAYVELLNVSLKLLIVFLLPVIGHDKLIVYGILVFAVSLLIAMTYRWYCFKKYPEVRTRLIFNKKMIYPMLSFSGWDIYVNMALMGRNQGVNILLNIFLGPIVNAAVNLGLTIQGVISAFGENVLTAIKPQIIKSYAKGEYIDMNKYMSMASGLATLLMSIISIPLIIEMDYILRLWLGTYPEGTVGLGRLCLIFSLIYIAFRPLVFGLHAVGNIKTMGLLNGTIYLLVLPVSYMIFKSKILNPEIPFYLNILLLLISYGVVNVFLLKKSMNEFQYLHYILRIIKILFIVVSTYLLLLLLHNVLHESFYRLLIIVLFSITFHALLAYILLLNKNERNSLKSFVLRKIKKN